MAVKHTSEELYKLDKSELVAIILSLQEQLDRVNVNLESLIEQIRLSNQQRFGRQTEKSSELYEQLSFFNEAERLSEDAPDEPTAEEVLPAPRRSSKKKGKRDKDLEGLPEEVHNHTLSDEKLDGIYGSGNWRRMAAETYKRLRYTPASWTVEIHNVDVAVGTKGDHQDEFTRADRPRDLLRNSLVTSSLGSAIMNAKYVNSIPYNRIEQHFKRIGINISRQNMADWTIKFAKRYLFAVYDRLHEELLKYPVNQAAETPVRVLNDGREVIADSYMWVHRSGEFYTERPIVLYEYQKTRHHIHPQEFYKDYTGILVTDGLQQYHMLETLIPGITSANCWAHARRDYADALKALGMKNKAANAQTIAGQALTKIGAFFNIEKELKSLTAQERLKERRKRIKPLVDEYFEWVKATLADKSLLLKGKTVKGLNYSVNQEKYLRVFLEDGDVPLDNSASERCIRTFCLGKKNWVLIDSIKGAQASAIIYSLAETAKLNDLNPYYYFEYLLSELPRYLAYDSKTDTVDTSQLDKATLEELLPWSPTAKQKCRNGRH